MAQQKNKMREKLKEIADNSDCIEWTALKHCSKKKQINENYEQEKSEKKWLQQRTMNSA